MAALYQGKLIKTKRDKGIEPVKKIFKPRKITPEIVDEHKWYALRVAPQKEFVVQVVVSRRGLMSYVPVRKEYKFRNKYEAKKRVKTLFSYPELVGYVLVGFSPGQISLENVPNWMHLFTLDYILGAVGVGENIHECDKESIKRFIKLYPNGMQRPDEEAYMRTHKEYKVGDSVRVCAGPFEGHVVPVVEIRKGVAVFETIFGKASIDSFLLEKEG